MLEKILSNEKSLEVNVAISRKKLCCTIFDKKNDRKQGEPKTTELTVCISATHNIHIWAGSEL